MQQNLRNCRRIIRENAQITIQHHGADVEENPPQGLEEKRDSSQRGTYITIVVIFMKINFFRIRGTLFLQMCSNKKELLDCWAVELLVCWTIRCPDYWFFLTIGLSEYLVVGLLGCQPIGLSDYWVFAQWSDYINYQKFRTIKGFRPKI